MNGWLQSNLAARQPQGATSRHTGNYERRTCPRSMAWRLEVESNQRLSAPKALNTTPQPTTPLLRVERSESSVALLHHRGLKRTLPEQRRGCFCPLPGDKIFITLSKLSTR